MCLVLGTVRARFSWRRRTSSCGTRKPARTSIRLAFTRSRDGTAVRQDGRHHGRDRPGDRSDSRARQVPYRAWRRALDYVAGRPRHGGEAPGRVGSSNRRPCRSARQLHGDAVQSRVRHAPRRRTCALHTGGHPQPVDRRSQGCAAAADHNLLRRQYASGQELDCEGRGVSRRDGLHHD